MLLAEGRGHEHLHILSNDLIFPTSEQTLGGGIEGLNDPRSSITTVASGTVSSTDLRCASRARRTRAVSRSWMRVR